MNTQALSGLSYSHPAIERFNAAVENLAALLQLIAAGSRALVSAPVWARLNAAIIRANQRRVEAMILNDPRISSEIRMAWLRRSQTSI